MRHLHYYRIKTRTHFELGYKLAKLFKSPSLDTYHAILHHIPLQQSILLDSQTYLHLTQEHFPQYLEELQGYAKGLDVDFESFWLTFLYEELNVHPEKCTTCFSTDGMIIGHNEDDIDYLKDRISLLEKTVDNITIFELYYSNSLGGDTCSINSHGYVQAINTLHHINKQIGVPRGVIARWLSETKSPKHDYEDLKKITRCMGYSHSFGNSKGEVINIESTAIMSQLVEPSLPFVHTNHYLTDLFKYEDMMGESNSGERYAEAKKRIGSVKNVQDMMDLLEYVTNLTSNNERASKTLARMVFDLKNKSVWCWLQRESSKGWIKYPIRFL